MFRLTEEQRLLSQSLGAYLHGRRNWRWDWPQAARARFAGELGLLLARGCGWRRWRCRSNMLIMRSFGAHSA